MSLRPMTWDPTSNWTPREVQIRQEYCLLPYSNQANRDISVALWFFKHNALYSRTCDKVYRLQVLLLPVKKLQGIKAWSNIALCISNPDNSKNLWAFVLYTSQSLLLQWVIQHEVQVVWKAGNTGWIFKQTQANTKLRCTSYSEINIYKKKPIFSYIFNDEIEMKTRISWCSACRADLNMSNHI